VSSRQERKVVRGARPFLEEGEEVLAAIIARPRGWTQSMAGSLSVGAAQQSRAYGAAEKAEFRLTSPMALAITYRRLLCLEIGSPIGLGIGGEVKGLVSSAPVADVDSIEVKRLPLGKRITITVRGVPIALEANALADASGVSDAFNRAKATARLMST